MLEVGAVIGQYSREIGKQIVQQQNCRAAEQNRERWQDRLNWKIE